MLYALGSNGNGQLGIGTYDDVSEPQQCVIQHDENDPPGTPISICAGGNHTLLLFDSGKLFSAGSNIKGQADIKSQENAAGRLLDPHATFTEIEFPAGFAKVKMCSATWEASIVVTCDDEIYAFGNGPNGELGTGKDNPKNLAKLSGIPLEHERIVDIASGIRHTVIVLSNGDVYGWGSGRKGQLGEPVGIVRTPRRIEGARSIKRATCGTEFTYLVGDPKDGRHNVLGSDKWGVKTQSPSIYMQDWKDIASSWGSIFVLKSDGQLVSWGRNDRGQLGLGEGMVQNLERIAVGSEHVLALRRSGQLLSWGWGEHGNNGPILNDNVEDGLQTRRIDAIQTPTTIVGLAAGCATSFVWSASGPEG